MAAVNAADVQLAATSPRLVTVPLLGSIDFSAVVGTTKPANNADVTSGAVNSGVVATSGGITLSGGGAIKGGQTAFNTGTGFFLGYSGTAYKFSIGNSSAGKLTWDGSALEIVGNITGAGFVDISGYAKFSGGVTNPETGGPASVQVNAGQATQFGLVSYAGVTGRAVSAYALQPGTVALYGYSSSGTGVSGQHVTSGSGSGVLGRSFVSTGTGVRAQNFAGGAALAVEGPMTMTDTTVVANLNAQYVNGAAPASAVGAGAGSTATFDGTNKPTATATSNTWWMVTIGGVNYYIPLWT